MLFKLSASTILSVFFLGLPLSLAESNSKRPKICLVLKGGGALGMAHVGVIKVLEELRVPIDCVAGTSMGAIVGAAYASGNSVENMQTVLSETDWDALFDESTPRGKLHHRIKAGRDRELFGNTKFSFKEGKLDIPLGVIEGQHLIPLFHRLFGHLSAPTNYDELSIPFRAVAADIETGEAYVPSSGNLSNIVRASMAFPGAFSPVEIDGKMLVDGGIVENLPVSTARGMGGEILIIIELESVLSKVEDLTTPLDITSQMVWLLMRQNSIQELKHTKPNDVVINVDVSKYGASQFAEAKALIQIGEEAARSYAKRLANLSLSAQDYATYKQGRLREGPPMPKLAFVRVRNNSRVPDARVKKHVRLKKGDIFDVDSVEEDIKRLYETGLFHTVRYDLVSEGGGAETGLQLEITGKDWLDQFVRFGFSLEDDINGEDAFRLAAAYRITGINNHLAYAELQTEIGRSNLIQGELFQPLGEGSPVFVAPILSLDRTDLPIRSGGEEIARYEIVRGLATFDLGYSFYTLGEARFGVTRGFGDLERDIGSPELPEFGFDIGELHLLTSIDTLDEPDLPTQGLYINLSGISSMEDLGASDNYEQISGQISKPFTRNQDTLILGAIATESFGTLPPERSLALGGFLNVSGFGRNSISASDYVQGSALLFRKFSSTKMPLFSFALFGGGSLELTSYRHDSSSFDDDNLLVSGSVFVGADTPLFPAYLGFGLSDVDEYSLYLILGRIGRAR